MTTVSIRPLLDRIQTRYQAGYAAGYQAACKELTAALDLDDGIKPTQPEPKPAIEVELIKLTPTQAKAVAHVQQHHGVTAWDSRHICSSTVFELLVERGLLEKRGTQLFPLNSAS